MIRAFTNQKSQMHTKDPYKPSEFLQCMFTLILLGGAVAKKKTPILVLLVLKR
jgi:hypothetical protein